MNLSKKHFIELAKIISEADDYINDTDRYKIANRIADYCETENNDFDRNRFLKACNFKDYQFIDCGCEKDVFVCAKHNKHKLNINSFYDVMADCPCGWLYRYTGEKTRKEIEEEYNKHLEY